MKNSWRTAIFLFCSVGLIALGAACPGGQIMFGGDMTTGELITGSDELIETTSTIDFTLHEGEDLTIDMPCEDIEQIVSSDVTFQSATTGAYLDVEQEIEDYGDGNCGLKYLPMDGGELRWLGEPLACDRYLADATIEMRTHRAAADTLNSKVATIDQTRTLTAEMRLHTSCPYSVEMPDRLGSWRGVAVGGDEAVGRMFLNSDANPVVGSYLKFLETFDSRSTNLPKLSTRLASSNEEYQSVALLSDANTGILVDVTNKNNECYVKAYDSVTGSRLWSKTFSDDSVDTYECIDASIGNLAILEERNLAEWGAPRYAVRILSISNGAEIASHMIDLAESGMKTISMIKPGLNGTYLMLMSDGDFNHLMRVTLGDVVAVEELTSDTDYTETRYFLADDSENVIYAFESVYKDSCACVVSTVFKLSANGDKLVGAELDIGDFGDLGAVKIKLVGDHIYAIASGDLGVVSKILTKNMAFVWKRYGLVNLSDFEVDTISGDIVMMGSIAGSRAVVPAILRVSVYGTHFGGIFFDSVDALEAALGGGGGLPLPGCPPEAEACF